MPNSNLSLHGSSAAAPAPARAQIVPPKPPVPAKPRVWLLLTVLLLAAGAVVVGLRFVRRTPVTPVATVPTATVRSGTLEKTIRLTGSTVAEHGVVLRAPYLRGSRSRGGARDFQLDLTKLAAPGSKVAEGEVVAVFDSVNMRNRLDDEKADRVDLEGRLKRLLADQLAERTAHDQKILTARAKILTAQLDLKTAPVRPAIDAQIFGLALEEAQATYKALTGETKYYEAQQAAERRSLELELERARVEEGRAQANIDRLTVHAPIAGLVVSQEIYRGGQYGQVRDGDQLRPGQPYVRIVDVRSMIVEAVANQADVTQLRIGEPVHVGFDAYPDLRLSGKVRAISAVARTEGWRPNYVAEVPLTIEIADTDPKVIPSLSASADIVLATAGDAAILPKEAVFYEGESEEPFAWVRTASGWERRALAVALENHVAVAVRSGVREGEVVALEPPGGGQG